MAGRLCYRGFLKPAMPKRPAASGAKRDRMSQTDNKTVCIVDDDEAVRDSLSLLLESGGLATRSFPSADAFLRAGAQDIEDGDFEIHLARPPRSLSAFSCRMRLIAFSLSFTSDSSNTDYGFDIGGLAYR